MRIAFFLHSFPRPTHTFILGHITGMIDRGHQVDIFADHQGAPPFHADVARYRLMERTIFTRPIPHERVSRLLGAGASLVQAGSRGQMQVLLRALNCRRYGRYASSLALLYRAATWISHGRHDVLHCQFGSVGASVLPLRQIGAVSGRLVTSFRGSDASVDLPARPALYRELFHQGEYFLPVSEGLKHRLIAYGCDERKIRVLHSGIDCRRFAYSERRWMPGEPVRLLTVARLVEKKGLEYAIEAVSHLLTTGRRLSYTIVGEGELQARLGRLIQERGIERQVSLLGRQAQEAVLVLLRQAHIFVAPSVTAANADEEGIPNSLKEAMAVGLPVVSTVHGGIPELVQDGGSGFLVPERDISALAERLGQLMDHPELWPAMGHTGRRRIESAFDSEKLNDELEQAYRA